MPHPLSCWQAQRVPVGGPWELRTSDPAPPPFPLWSPVIDSDHLHIRYWQTSFSWGQLFQGSSVHPGHCEQAIYGGRRSHCLCPPACVSLHLQGRFISIVVTEGLFTAHTEWPLSSLGSLGLIIFSQLQWYTLVHTHTFKITRAGKGIWRGGGRGWDCNFDHLESDHVTFTHHWLNQEA